MKGYYNHETGLWTAVVSVAGFPVKVIAKTITGLVKLITKLTSIKK